MPIGDFLFGTKWTPLLGGDQQSFGVIPLLTGTLYLTAIGLVVAIPLGLLAAIYLSEYAPQRVRKVVKPVLELLAGVPTIVFGYFALTFFTPEVLRGVFGLDVNQFNALSAGIILGLLVLPTIASVAEDALTAVPASLREGAFGLGASKLQVSLRVVFPAALSGVVAALILGASRAVGETVIILVAGGQVARLGLDPTGRLPVDGRVHRRDLARRHPDGLDQVRDDLRRRHGAVRHDARAQRALDPARQPLPPGVRMTGAQIAADGAHADERPAAALDGLARRRHRLPRDHVPRRSRSGSSGSARSSSTSRATGSRGSRGTSSPASRRGSSRSAPASSRRSSGRST